MKTVFMWPFSVLILVDPQLGKTAESEQYLNEARAINLGFSLRYRGDNQLMNGTFNLLINPDNSWFWQGNN